MHRYELVSGIIFTIVALAQLTRTLLGWPAQVQPTSCRQRTPEQPSPLVALWSSHVSPPRRSPSPQIGAQWLGTPEQSQPGSIWQVGLQPSPATLSPSSHVSPAST